MQDIFIARQPIFDSRDRLIGHELLYRTSSTVNRAEGASSEQMSADVIVDAFMEIGLERLTRGKLGFINFSRDMLLTRAFELMDRDKVIVELLEHIEPDEEILSACKELVDAGYRLALDDFVLDEEHEPLLEFAHIVKLDVLDKDASEIREMVKPLKNRKLQLLAERVETAEVRDTCRAIGFEYFQGYYFGRPEIVSKRAVGVEQLGIIELINLLADEDADDAKIEETFRADPSLSYKLLGMVNSAAHGGRGIESIGHAVRLLGRSSLQRWLGLLLISSLGTRGARSGEMVHSAVMRARLCELLGTAVQGHRDAGPLFIVGLFSRLDALLDTSLEDILGRLKLADGVKDALLRREGPYSGWLELVEAYEEGQWDTLSERAEAVGLPAVEIPELYLQSLGWASERVAGNS
ncbi:MAG TPA: EAL domain-containing protein [Longimicrobiaceae bacterium]|nr:EAL domain-containing protein [Longimicrobiaceae bacterium]